MAITAEQWQTRLDAYLAAEIAVLASQSYKTASGRELVRAELAQIRAGIKECNQALARLMPSARGRTRYLVPE
jgi:hypothetical protein